MKQVLALILASILAAPFAGVAAAQDTDTEESTVVSGDTEVAEVSVVGPVNAADVALDDFKWKMRPIVVFADTDADPRFQDQLSLLLERVDALEERDIIIITDTDPAGASDIRIKLRPRGFQLTLIGKDGAVKLRKPLPWDVREISRVIDKMPMRQQEIRDRSLGD